MQHGHTVGMQHGHTVGMQHGEECAAWIGTGSMDRGMQHGLGHAA
jgi:hypothetical protein